MQDRIATAPASRRPTIHWGRRLPGALCRPSMPIVPAALVRSRVAMAPESIFTMRRVGRFHPPDRQVLEDISLSFYPGAKIGVIGGNGAGKSSLLRIMAGQDDDYSGEARLTPGFSVGFLEQEPHLDESKTVFEN